MSTLNLKEASEFIKMHKQTVRTMAIAGKIPAAKPGKRWVFIENDLLDWLRGQYIEPRQDVRQGGKECYINEKTARTIGINSQSTEGKYNDLLGLESSGKRKK